MTITKNQEVRVSIGVNDPIRKAGEPGIVIEFTKDQDVKVKFQDGQMGVYNPECLEELPDDYNSEFLFSTTATYLLIKIAKGEIDPKQLALEMLSNRGLNESGSFVGFK